MTSSYYSATTDDFFANRQSQSGAPKSHYSSYQLTNSSDDDDDDLDELRKAALKTLNSKKRQNNHDRSPLPRNPRSSSSFSSRSSDTSSSISRSLSPISSDSLDRHDKDYRFENEEKQTIGDIDERFPQDIPSNDDMLIVDCPVQDDDLLAFEERKPVDRDERQPSKEIVKRRRRKSPSIERPVSVTVKLNSDQFDLRQLIKKRRTNESPTSTTNHRVVQVLPTDKNNLLVHKKVHESRSAGKH